MKGNGPQTRTSRLFLETLRRAQWLEKKSGKRRGQEKWQVYRS